MANTSINMQKSVRDNTVPNGGVTNPSGMDNALNSLKMPIIPETSYFESFRGATEFNSIMQSPVNATQGQQASFQVHNIGFLETCWTKFECMFTLKTSGTANTYNFGEDFPYSLINRVVSQFNGQVVTHSSTPYNLLALSTKRNTGFKFPAVANGTQTADTEDTTLTQGGVAKAANAKINSLSNHGLYGVEITAVNGAGNGITTTKGLANGLTTLKKVSLAGTANNSVTMKCWGYIPIHYTPRKDNLIGLIPLQNNSVFLDVKLDVASVLGSDYNAPISTTATDVIDSYSMVIKPIIDFYSVPAPYLNSADIYKYLIMYNYIVSDTTVQTTGTGRFLNYNMPNNSFLASIMTTFRKSTDHSLLNIDDVLSSMYIDYNGTAIVRNTPSDFDIMKANLLYTGGWNLPKGVFCKDFFDSLNGANGQDWSRFINLYDATSPQLVAYSTDTAPNMDVNVTLEKIVPVSVMA